MKSLCHRSANGRINRRVWEYIANLSAGILCNAEGADYCDSAWFFGPGGGCCLGAVVGAAQSVHCIDEGFNARWVDVLMNTVPKVEYMS